MSGLFVLLVGLGSLDELVLSCSFVVVLWAWAVSIFPGARAGSGLCVTLFLFFPRLDLSVVFLGLR